MKCWLLLCPLLGQAAVCTGADGDIDEADLRWARDFIGPPVTLSDEESANAAAHYWTDIVGVPFTRDALLDLPATPLDLNLDGRTDLTYQGHWSLPGGILGNPAKVGLVATPDDPAGTVGTYSISTGFLGVRQELDPKTRRGTGRYAFNCWVCHGAADENGRILLGVANTNIDLGLIMATSNVMNPDYVIRASPAGPPITAPRLIAREALDDSFDFDADRDGRVTIREWRRAMNMPPADVTRAMLMLAGPGRLDQSIDHRMDGNIPLANLQHHNLQSYGRPLYLRQARQRKSSVFNPVSIPANRSGMGVRHYSYSGKDSSTRHDAARRLSAALNMPLDRLAQLLHISAGAGAPDVELFQRAITLDFRNVATGGLESDQISGNAWPGDVLERPGRAVLARVPAAFGAVRLRSILTRPLTGPTRGDPQVDRGREIFVHRIIGKIINQRVVWGREARVPEKLRGIAVIAPLDRTQPLDAMIPVRCATCHNYSPLASLRPIETPLRPMQRCDICHFDHPLKGRPDRFVSLAAQMRAEVLHSVEDCLHCHDRHPDFGPQVHSNSWVLPFDADGNGRTQGDESTDAVAGGIGTDAYLNLDTLFDVQRRRTADRPKRMYLVTHNVAAVPSTPRFFDHGLGWVRVTPLISLARTAPYLHNGSVPTLEALLSDPASRPTQFRVGRPEQKFTFDARLPGNSNAGHRFGVDLTADQRRDLIAFLNALP